MPTTLEIPDHILKHAKRRAAEEGRSLKDVVTQALASELNSGKPAQTKKWRVPVAPAGMGWHGLSEDQIERIRDTERTDLLLHRAALDSPNEGHAQH